MAEAPNSYRDPYWTQVAAQAEARNGLPPGVVQAIVLHGERSNNDQVSSAGARTPFQIIPSTRDLFLKKYGVDAYLSPENAATVAALHIKESLQRGASLPRAVAEYNGGTDPAKWDKTVPSYVNRVLSGLSGSRGAQAAPTSTFQRVMQEQKPTAEAQLAQVYDAYKTGKMNAQELADFENDVTSGKIMLPKGATLTGQKAPAASNVLPDAVLAAYEDGRMLREDKIELERDVANGVWTLPAGKKLGKTDSRGIVGSVVEAVTGAERSTPTTNRLQDWAAMPELNQASFKSFLAGLGTLTAGPQEIAQIIKSQFPGVQPRQDEKGNIILKSAADGKEYAIKPGAQWSDLPRAIGAIAAFTPASRATTVLGSAAASAGTQGVIEGTQAAAGGTFNPGEVAIAGGIGAAVPLAVRAVQAVRNPGAAALEQAAPSPTAAAIAGTERRAAAFDDRGVMDGRRATDPQNADPSVFRSKRAPDAPTSGATPPPAQPAANVPRGTTQAAADIAPDELAALIKTASSDRMGAVRAQERIAQAAKLNPEARAAADRLGIELPPDVFSDSHMLREAVGLTRSAAGSPASAAWRESIETATRKADEAIGALDASPNVAAVSQKVLGSLTTARNDLEKGGRALAEQVNAQVPGSTKVVMPRLQQVLGEVKASNPNTMSAQEKNLEKLLKDGDFTYGDLRRAKDSVGDAIAGRQNDFSGMSRGPLKRLYGALAEDQLANVERIGGASLADDLRKSNALYVQKYALDKRIVNAFGQDNAGSIANVMRQSIEAGSKGDVKALNKLLEVVPQELQKETVATALMSAARAKGGAMRGDFGFSEFNKLYTGLRQNEPVYARVVAALGGKDAHNLLSDLNTVSKRITDARANVLTTGKANQALVDTLKAESLVSKVLSSTTGRAAAVGASAAGTGPVGAMLASAVVNAVGSGKKNAIEAAGKLFASPEFQKVMLDAATGKTPPAQEVRRLATSKRFSAFANAVAIPRDLPARERWILQALDAANAKGTEDKK